MYPSYPLRRKLSLSSPSIIMGYDGACTFPEACPSHPYSCQFRFTVTQYLDLVMPAWQRRARKARWQLILDWSKFVESILVGPKGKHFYGGKAKWNESCSVVSDSLRPYGLWNSPGQNTGAGSLPFSRGSSQSRDWTQVSHTSGGFFTSWATREAQWWW